MDKARSVEERKDLLDFLYEKVIGKTLENTT